MSENLSVIGRPLAVRRRPFDTTGLSDRLACWLSWAARLWAIAATIIFLVLGLRDGVPTNPELGEWQQPAQLALLGLVALGSLLAWRWEALGATVITFGAVFLGVLATVENSPQIALFAALVFLVPGILFWFVWQRRQPLKAVFLLAVAMAALLVAGGYASATVYDYLFGPTHPQSALQALPIDQVEWIWAGATTSSSVTVKAKLAHDSTHVQLHVSEHADMTNARVTKHFGGATTGGQIVTFTVDGLNPNMRYYYAVEADGHVDLTRQGQFTTFPDGPASFSFAFSSCARTGSNGVVFDAIRASDPLFYMNVGDLHYTYIDEDDPDLFRAQYAKVLDQPAQAALYRSTSFAYVWDDHDYGPNDGDRTSPTRDAAREVYQEYVPHYALVAPDEAIYHAFSVGRVRFIVTDIRSERDPDTELDNAGKSMLGEAQKAWFKQQLLDANGEYPVIIWVNSGPWIDAAGVGKDTWGGFTTERRELADFIADNQIEGLLMLSGDAHMVAIDDGTHSDFSTKGGGGFPVLHAAPLDKRGSVKGGPYSEGTSAESGQFGLVTVDDDGGSTVTVTLSGRNYEGREIAGYTFTVPAYR
jgi:hypothetical protein